MTGCPAGLPGKEKEGRGGGGGGTQGAPGGARGKEEGGGVGGGGGNGRRGPAFIRGEGGGEQWGGAQVSPWPWLPRPATTIMRDGETGEGDRGKGERRGAG